jgi:hypothetical protein
MFECFTTVTTVNSAKPVRPFLVFTCDVPGLAVCASTFVLNKNARKTLACAGVLSVPETTRRGNRHNIRNLIVMGTKWALSEWSLWNMALAFLHL